MDLVYNLLIVLHLIGWAIVLGGTLVNLRTPKIATGVLHGILTALVTGLLLAGIASAGLAGHEPDNAKLAVKLVVALVVTALVIMGVRKPSRVTTGYLGAIAGLVVVNVAVAVLWH
jgi:hypothetical protein